MYLSPVSYTHLYNVPSRTGVNIAPDLVAELANECKNIVAIKEASGDIAQVAEVARLVPDRCV